MEKFYTSLGLMSGTSMDGVDASIIRSDGENNYEPIFDKYFEYDEVIYSDLLNLRDKINSIKDLTTNSYQINELERKITLFHAKVIKEINNENRKGPLSQQIPKTIDFTVDYLRSGLPQDAYAKAEVKRAGRRYASVYVEAWQVDQNKLYSQASGHFLMPVQRG